MNNEELRYHGGNIYAAARDSGGKLTDYLDFSANINPLGLSAAVRSALFESLEQATCYPDPDAMELKQTIAATYQVSPDCIETGNGAVELIYLLCRVFDSSRVVLPAPTFGEYAAGARAAGLPVHHFSLLRRDGFRPDWDRLAAELTAGDLLFFCNPNNPTGVVCKRKEIKELAVVAARVGARLVIDESFIDFRREDGEESCRSLVGETDNVVVLHSLTKYLAVPGLRLGFCLAPPQWVRKLSVLRDPWNVNVLAQVAGVAGLRDRDYRRDTLELVERERRQLWQAIRQIGGLDPFEPSVNYLLFEIQRPEMDAVKLQQKLLPAKILIRNCASFAGLSERFVRVAVKLPEQNLRLIEAINNSMSGEGAK